MEIKEKRRDLKLIYILAIKGRTATIIQRYFYKLHHNNRFNFSGTSKRFFTQFCRMVHISDTILSVFFHFRTQSRRVVVVREVVDRELADREVEE